jgi:Flp pilus assembly CpaE family ATPase
MPHNRLGLQRNAWFERAAVPALRDVIRELFPHQVVDTPFPDQSAG